MIQMMQLKLVSNAWKQWIHLFKLYTNANVHNTKRGPMSKFAKLRVVLMNSENLKPINVCQYWTHYTLWSIR